MANNDGVLGASFSIDITDLKAGLLQANRLIKESESEFKSAAAGLDDWSKSEQGLTDKLKSLNDITAIQQKKVNALKEQYDKLISEGLDPTSKEAVQLRTQINNETAALEKNKKQTKDLENTLNDYRAEAEKTGKSVDEVAQGMDDAGKAAEKSADGFTIAKGAMADLISNGIQKLVEIGKEAISTFLSLGESTREYREDIGKLETAFNTAGFSTEQATAVYKEFYSVLGEEDRSVEAVNHLAKLVDTEEDLQKWTNICAGVWGTFGDSLPIEGLTEAANETAKVGDLTGVLADALNWAGINEDEFQAKLDKCNDESERAALITDTLNGLYAEAADNYKEINKDVITARKSQSEYTDAMAELGEEVEPLTTAITEFKTELIKGVVPALKNKVIPKVKEFIKTLKEKGVIDKASKSIEWLSDNIVEVGKVTLTAITVFKAFQAVMKVSTAITAAQTAIKGLTAGVGLATKAQTVWNAVMTANPIGAVITAVALLTAGIALLVTSMDKSTTSQDLLSESQREAVTAAEETAKAYDELKTSATDVANAELANLDYTQRLWGELQNLTDANGKVKEGYEGRAQFILNELNNALGTEYSMNGDIIEQYGEMVTSIGNLIEAKKAQMLLENYQETYKTAIEAVGGAEEARAIKAQELALQEERVANATKSAQEAQEKYNQAVADGISGRNLELLQGSAQGYLVVLEGEKKALEEMQKAYNETNDVLNGYYTDIATYEEASAALLEGNSAKAIELLTDYANGFQTVTSTAKLGAEEQKKILEQQVIDTEINAELMKQAYKDGVEGVTEEMVATAEEQAERAKTEFANIGGNIVKGIADGAGNSAWILNDAMQNIIAEALAAAEAAADINSPSRVFRDEVGKMIGAGIAVGLDESTKDAVKSVKNQVGAIKNAYDIDGISGNLSVASQNANGTNSQAGKNVVVYQTNNYSQAHSRYELYKTKQTTAAAVRLAMGTV